MPETPEDGQKKSSQPRVGAPKITINTSTASMSNDGAGDSHSHSPQSTAAPPNGTRPVGDGANFLHVPGRLSHDQTLDTPLTPSTLGGETITASSGSNGTNAVSDDDEDPLKPDRGNEAEFVVENNKFAYSPGQLAKLINPKSLAAFKALGGLSGLEYGLRTNREIGLSQDEHGFSDSIGFEQTIARANGAEQGTTPQDTASGGSGDVPFADRLRVYGDNRLPEKQAKTIWTLMWIAFNDKILILLSFAAAISLALGLYQTFGVKHEDGAAKVEWVEGVAIIVAILIVVMVGAGNDWQKERQFVKLNKKKEDRVIDVTRSAKDMQISVYDLLVGDIVHLKPGDLIPVDGIFISGHGVKCDESSATGESDQMKKTGGDEVWKLMQSGGNYEKLDPFIISGSKVLEGVGKFLVTSVGVHSSYGKTMMALREDSDATPLQMKLNNLAEAIAKLGGASALLLFVVLLIRFLVSLKDNKESSDDKGQNFMRILITSITVVVVAVPEGLPLAVTLALAFATTRMLKDNNLVRVLRACETMGNATTVCSDKTGTLTQNKMTVVAGVIGSSICFGPEWDFSLDEEAKEEKRDFKLPAVGTITEARDRFPSSIKATLLQSIVANSTAFEETNGGTEFIGSKTETALLGYAKNHLGMGPLASERANSPIVQLFPFDSERKCMGCVVKTPTGYRLYVKGASEILLAACRRIINADDGEGVSEMTSLDNDNLNEIIVQYATRSLRTIGLVYKDFAEWPPAGAEVHTDNPEDAHFDSVFNDMVFFGIVGIQDPLRDGVKEAVDDCRHAGVVVRMVTGDNVMTAKAIARDCGILQAGGVVMEGPKFRQLDSAEMAAVIPRLRVLARSSPEDKRILVKKLKELGETVAVTGDGTNDGPALKTADVGFSMGIAGTEVAKEASAIILMDDNFASIVKAIMWGRAVNDAVKKFLQFQLTVNITAVLTTFVTAVASDKEESVLTAVQLLWVNLIMDTFAALALATDPPTRKILDRKPEPKSAPLITVNMWKMILGQAVYQLIVSFVLHFAGGSILNLHTEEEKTQLKALVFNTFVWLQIFNQYNNRRLDNKFNIFEGITHNWFFIGINVVMVGGQIMIIFVGGRAFSVTRLDGVQWAISIILGLISLPVAVLIRLIPDEWFAKLIPDWMLRKDDGNVYVSQDERFEWSKPYLDIREELSFLKTIRGGRVNQLKWKGRMAVQHIPGFRPSSPGADNAEQPPPSPSTAPRKRSRSNSAFGTMVAVLPGVVAGGIGGSSPVDRKGMNLESIQFPPPPPSSSPKPDKPTPETIV
ncbi:hypothetical protein DFH27DRAFT_606546 [Peziza echinospora]|nr:hypothetical protein DFH27DRAFT_606546 [Peziza echinospora]